MAGNDSVAMNIKRISALCYLLICAACCSSLAQTYTSASIFAHNDYVHATPFHISYQWQVGYIEADIFLKDSALLVAHTAEEVTQSRTLDSLYLQPLQQHIAQNKGHAYLDSLATLTLMIDIKTEGSTTLRLLQNLLTKYPQLVACKTLRILISGNVPEPATWHHYASFIYFDGRPGVHYTESQLKRIGLISADFKTFSSWNGVGTMKVADRNRISALITDVHHRGKKIRFWGTPDTAVAWRQFMSLGIDVLNTDHVQALAEFIRSSQIPDR